MPLSLPAAAPSAAPSSFPIAARRRIARLGTLLGALALCAAVAPAPAAAQGRRGRDRGAESAPAPAPMSPAARDSGRSANERDFLRLVETPPVVTHHAITINGQVIHYTAYTGMMPIKDDTAHAPQAGVFYVAYFKDGANPATRPLSFLFNGGPGSASVWLHMGAFGPKRVHLNADGTAPPPPWSFEDNPNTLLDQTDMVFIDPVGTGYSRAATPALGPKYWGLDEDIAEVGEFIRLFLTRYDRWGSPRFLGGESYGTTRATGLSGYLADRGIAFNGIILISAVLNFENSADRRGNDIGFMGFLPSYTAIAWYHHKLPADLQKETLEQVTSQAEQWTENQYNLALFKGASMTPAERQTAVEQMSRFTGLDTAFVDANDLRVTLSRFDQELLRGQHQTVGRLDGRFTTYATDAGGERGAFDPSEASIRNTFTPVMSEYVRNELGYKLDEVYYILGGGIGRWHYPTNGQGFADVTPSIERAFAKNPYQQLFVAMGYYDTATPYYAVEYTLSHLAVSPEIRANNIHVDHFAAGHMMYIDQPSMTKLRKDLREFIDRSLHAPAATTAAAAGGK